MQVKQRIAYYFAGEDIKKGSPIYLKDNKAYPAKDLSHFIKGFALDTVLQYGFLKVEEIA